MNGAEHEPSLAPSRSGTDAPHELEQLRTELARRDRRIVELEAQLVALRGAAAPRKPTGTFDASESLARLQAWLQRSGSVLAWLERGMLAFADRLAHPFAFVLAALLLQLPITLNQGYFNHDELQWLAFADQPSLGEVPWNAWFDLEPFQYRPLTFNLWLLLAHWLGYKPIAMHFVRVAFGIAAALLLRATLLAFGATPRRAVAAALLFLLLPETVYTHGWIGTYADTLCLAFALGALLWILRAPPTADAWSALKVALPVAGLTELALLSKESAIVLPGLLLLAALVRRDRSLLVALAASGAVVALYLGLRLETILFTPHDGDAYAWQLGNVPQRLGEYALFPFLFTRFEPANSFTDGHLWLGLVALGVFLLAVATAGWRAFALLCVGWVAALGPILILGFSASHYAYLAAAFVSGWLAWHWPLLRPAARAALVVLAIGVCAHGVGVAKEMRNIGRVQHHLYADLGHLLADPALQHVTIKAERNKEDFILRRMLHEIPSYHRLPLGDRFVAIPFADKAAQPDYWMAGNGRLRPARK